MCVRWEDAVFLKNKRALSYLRDELTKGRIRPSAEAIIIFEVGSCCKSHTNMGQPLSASCVKHTICRP